MGNDLGVFMAIELSKDTEKYLLGSVKRFFSEELDEEIGDLKAGRVLGFMLREVGPSVYNQAMADAQSWMKEKVEELGDARYEPEFDFWKRK